MKPRLLKFACPGCGARLAVPPEMAGLSDQCPKCGVVVTAPLPAVAESVGAVKPVLAPVVHAPEGWSSDALADALNPPRHREPELRREVQPDLLERPQDSIIPSAPPAPATPRKPAHEVLDSILRRKEPPTATPRVPAEMSEETLVAKPFAAGFEPDERDEPPPPGPRSALVPQHVTDADELESAAMPGMGEVLAGVGAGGHGAGSDSRPFLHVPFVPVRSSPSEDRRAWRTHLKVTLIVCFLLFDVLALFIWKDQISAWWSGPGVTGQVPSAGDSKASPKGRSGPVAVSPAKPDAVASQESVPAGVSAAKATQPASSSVPSGAAVPAPPVAGGLPLAPLPEGIMSPSAGSLTLASPADFSAAVGTSGSVAPPSVPMAIPLPGHSSDNVPMATPVASSSGASAPAPQTKDLDKPSTAAIAEGLAPMAAGSSVPPATPTAASVPTPPPVPEAMAATGPAIPVSVDLPLAPAVDPLQAAGERRVGRVTAEAKSALEALLKFLDAPTWRERAAYAQKSAGVLEAMEAHATTYGDGPVVVGQVDFVERYPAKASVPPYCMFELNGGALKHPVLVLVEQSPKNGVRVDWEAFVEFKDDLLLQFLEKKGAPPHKFRVMLRRKHYFDKDVPDIAGKDSFQLEQPNSRFEGHVFVVRNSTTGKQLANQLAWGQDMPVIAELVWKSDAKSWWVEIGAITSYGWRG